LDSPKGLTKKNCLRIGLDGKLNNDGAFKVLGAYSDDPITTMDDPRLVEAAKRERAFFIFDTLSKVFEGNDENNPSDANAIMSKGSRLAYASEGVLILHHDAKGGKFGYRGSTPIVAVPDMSFNLSREKGQNVAVLEQIRFKDVEDYAIKVELNFGSFDRLILDNRYEYKTLFDSLSVVDRNIASVERQHAVIHRNAKDAELIQKAKEIIEAANASSKPGMSQNSLAKQLGIKDNRTKERVLCASTKDDYRPWKMERTDRNWLVFLPLPKETAKTVPTQEAA
jgi:RecA-family ATPase